ncbi:MAG TPA: hypothetical protein VIU11_07460 [Nakamurella sp.]
MALGAAFNPVFLVYVIAFGASLWGSSFAVGSTDRARLSAADDADLIAGRHARWCLDQVTGIHRLLVGPAEAEGVARLALRDVLDDLEAPVHVPPA